MSRIETLLAAFLAVLSAHGLERDALDSWRGWLAFKEYARTTADYPDPGVSVHLELGEDDAQHLFFLRQALVRSNDRLEPVGGVVCEFTFPAPLPHSRTPTSDYWSFDYATFERFVDAVEQDPVIAELFVHPAASSKVYWEEA